MRTTAEDILAEKGSEMISVSPRATIQEAIQVMVEKRIGAILIRRRRKIIGIWTERDLLRKSADPDFDPSGDQIGDHMTTDLVSIPHNTPLIKIKDSFLGRRIRRILVERRGRYIGLLTAGDVMRASLAEQESELRQLEDIVHLDFYEDWKWKKKRST